MRNGKVANIKVTPEKLFQWYMDVTKPFHKLSDQHALIVSQLLYYYYIYGKSISDDDITWKMVFNYETKAKIKEYVNIKDQQLQNILSVLRKKGIIKNNKIIDSYIPNIEPTAKSFMVVFNLTLQDGK
jgi:hypothetical protein